MKCDTMNILLVDDDKVDVMNVKRAFKKNNVSNPLHVAENGIEALSMLRGNGNPELRLRPKIILLDLNMPRMNGIDFLKELRTDPDLKSISVIVLTTSNEERDIVAAHDLNVSGYILKPVEFDNFVAAIKTLKLYWTLNELP